MNGDVASGVAVIDDPEADKVPTAEAVSETPAPAVPAGWTLLPGGVTRQVRVFREAIGSGRRVYDLFEGPGTAARYFACAHEVKFLGAARFVHHPDYQWCGKQGLVYAETDGPILLQIDKAS